MNQATTTLTRPEAFQVQVPFRDSSSFYPELQSNTVLKNYWGSGVRPITADAFRLLRQLGRARVTPGSTQVQPQPTSSGQPEGAELSAIWRARKPAKEGTNGASRKAFDYRRLSRRAKAIGDEAERIFLDALHTSEPDHLRRKLIRWVARDGETPGYDIEDNRHQTLHAYEVKGTTGAQFLSIDLTLNELLCAKMLRKQFNLVLVAGVFTKKPKIVVLNDPATALEDGLLDATATCFRIDLVKS